MAINIIYIEFEPCEPAPANGYLISYRPLGSLIDYRTATASTSPAVILDVSDPIGTSYEGIIQGDCGGGLLGVPVPWEAPNSISISGSASASEGSASGSFPPPPTFNYEVEVYLCSACGEPIGTIVAASTNEFLVLFKFYKAQFGGDVVYRPISTSLGIAADNIVGFAFDTCLEACEAPDPPED